MIKANHSNKSVLLNDAARKANSTKTLAHLREKAQQALARFGDADAQASNDASDKRA